MPFDDHFWALDNPSSMTPKGIEGFWTSFPVNWTKGEYNQPGPMDLSVLTMNTPLGGPATELASASGRSEPNGIPRAS